MGPELSTRGLPTADATDPNQVGWAFLLEYSGHTRDAYRSDLRAWFAFCEDFGVAVMKAQQSHLNLFVRWMDQNEQRSPATVARRLSTLSSFYGWALNEGLVTQNPVARVPRPRLTGAANSHGLDKDELRSLLRTAAQDSPRSYALLLLLGLNGLRISEALGARVNDLSEEQGHWVLRVARTGGGTTAVPLAPPVVQAIAAYVGVRHTGPLFATRSGLPLSRESAFRIVRRLVRQALPTRDGFISPQSLRHAFITLSLQAGASLNDVQDAAGHAGPRTTRRYDSCRDLEKHPTYALAELIG